MAMLKNNWKATGNNPAAETMADWMNKVSNLFNFATIPSGGTATATDSGFQIEVDSGDAVTTVFDTRYVDGKIQIYGVESGVAVMANGTFLSFEDGDTGDYTWYDYATTATYDQRIYAIAKKNPAVVVDWDYNDPANLVWNIVTALPTNWQAYYVQPIADVVVAASVATIDQIHRGVVHFQSQEPDDALERNLSADAVKTQRSIAHLGNDSTHGALEIYGFESPTAPATPYNKTALRFLLRDAVSATFPLVKYVTWQDVEDDIIDEIKSSPTIGEINGLLTHSLLDDIADFSVTDDHAGTRTKVAGTDNPLIHANGSATRNAMLGNIGDSGGAISIQPSGRTLVSGIAVTVLNWALQRCYDLDGKLSVDWGEGTGGRMLYNAAETAVIEWARKALGDAFDAQVTGGLNVATGDYYHAGVKGVTADGFSGGIKTDEAASDAHTIDLIEMYT